jgi:hypothetical protein
MTGCPMYNLLTTSVRIMQLQPFLNNYCLSRDRHRKCSRFQIIETGIEPSASLLPDGKIMKA